MKNIFLTLLVSSVCIPAFAQHHGHHPHAQRMQHGSPYAGMQQRPVKALSEQQIEGLRAARGMGMAMPAELNGYPGPLHVLELAKDIQLSDTQIARTRELYAEMQTEAKTAGERVIDAERELDQLFANRKANRENLAAAVTKAAAAQGKLRETHLRYHLLMMEVLTPEQITAYNRLRGY